MVPELTYLLILGLATWRVSSLLVHEAGPWDIFVKLRNSFGFTHDSFKHKVIIPDGFWGDLLSCVWCCSLFMSVGWVVFYILFPGVALYTALVFALSTIAVIIQAVVEK